MRLFLPLANESYNILFYFAALRVYSGSHFNIIRLCMMYLVTFPVNLKCMHFETLEIFTIMLFGNRTSSLRRVVTELPLTRNIVKYTSSYVYIACIGVNVTLYLVKTVLQKVFFSCQTCVSLLSFRLATFKVATASLHNSRTLSYYILLCITVYYVRLKKVFMKKGKHVGITFRHTFKYRGQNLDVFTARTAPCKVLKFYVIVTSDLIFPL